MKHTLGMGMKHALFFALVAMLAILAALPAEGEEM